MSYEDAQSEAGSPVLRWLMVVGVALVLAVMIRSFVIEPFHIPSRSMEKSLLAGDAVLVSKLHYGPRLPATVGVPFTNLYLPNIELPSLRLPGFSSVQRSDIVVFNYPVEQKPLDRKTHYVKRAVGLPGDSLSIREKELYVNGKAVPMGEHIQQQWVAEVQAGSALPSDSLRAVGATPTTDALLKHAGRITFEATRSIASKVEAWEEVDEVSALVHDSRSGRGGHLFPRGSRFSRDDYGPIYVPAAGDTVALTPANWPMYERVITRYEDHEVKREEGTFLIDGEKTDRYVFSQDYYFVLGDNRDNSSDSRVWGFVPADHLVGKVVMVYFSWNKIQEQLRYDRIMQFVN